MFDNVRQIDNEQFRQREKKNSSILAGLICFAEHGLILL